MPWVLHSHFQAPLKVHVDGMLLDPTKNPQKRGTQTSVNRVIMSSWLPAMQSTSLLLRIFRDTLRKHALNMGLTYIPSF